MQTNYPDPFDPIEEQEILNSMREPKEEPDDFSGVINEDR